MSWIERDEVWRTGSAAENSDLPSWMQFGEDD